MYNCACNWCYRLWLLLFFSQPPLPPSPYVTFEPVSTATHKHKCYRDLFSRICTSAHSGLCFSKTLRNHFPSLFCELCAQFLVSTKYLTGAYGWMQGIGRLSYPLYPYTSYSPTYAVIIFYFKPQILSNHTNLSTLKRPSNRDRGTFRVLTIHCATVWGITKMKETRLAKTM